MIQALKLFLVTLVIILNFAIGNGAFAQIPSIFYGPDGKAMSYEDSKKTWIAKFGSEKFQHLKHNSLDFF